MKDVVIALIIAWSIVSLCSRQTMAAKIEKIVSSLTEMKKFFAYLDDHKGELPPNIRERYDELVKFCNKQNKENSGGN